MLAIFIFTVNPNVTFKIFKSSCNGETKPKSLPYASHHSPPTFDAISPINPPITKPDKIKINNIQKFFSYVAIFISLSFVLFF